MANIIILILLLKIDKGAVELPKGFAPCVAQFAFDFGRQAAFGFVVAAEIQSFLFDNAGHGDGGGT